MFFPASRGAKQFICLDPPFGQKANNWGLSIIEKVKSTRPSLFRTIFDRSILLAKPSASLKITNCWASDSKLSAVPDIDASPTIGLTLTRLKTTLGCVKASNLRKNSDPTRCAESKPGKSCIRCWLERTSCSKAFCWGVVCFANVASKATVSSSIFWLVYTR